MLNLLISLLILCSTLGATISKITTDYGVRKQRQHTRPLRLDKDVL
jgi:hypothetical protein